MRQHTIFCHWLVSNAHRSHSIRRLLCWDTRTSSKVSTTRWLNRHYCRETSRKIPCSTSSIIMSNRRMKIKQSLKRAMRRMSHLTSPTTGSYLNHSWTRTFITKMPLKTSFSTRQLKSSSTLWSLGQTMTLKLSFPMQAKFTKSKISSWGIMRVRITCTRSTDLSTKGTRRRISCALSCISIFSSSNNNKCLNSLGATIHSWWNFWAPRITKKKVMSNRSLMTLSKSLKSLRRSRLKLRGREWVSQTSSKISISLTQFLHNQILTNQQTPSKRTFRHSKLSLHNLQIWTSSCISSMETSTTVRFAHQDLRNPRTYRESFFVETAFASVVFVHLFSPKLSQALTKAKGRQPDSSPASYASRCTSLKWRGTASSYATKSSSKSEMITA